MNIAAGDSDNGALCVLLVAWAAFRWLHYSVSRTSPDDGLSGSVSIFSGSTKAGEGGAFAVATDYSQLATGGTVQLESGSSTAAGSGSVNIYTANSTGYGPWGQSRLPPVLLLSTPQEALSSRAETRRWVRQAILPFLQAPALSMMELRSSSEGGDTGALSSAGGLVTVRAGDGTNTDAAAGGSGGSVAIQAGSAYGYGASDTGGDVDIAGGDSVNGLGGSITLSSGVSASGSSGAIGMTTGNAGTSGVSGNIDLITGVSSGGASGAITLSSGEAQDGSAGEVSLLVGSGDQGDGGDITITAGKRSTAQATQGGSIYLTAGLGANSHSNDGGDGGDIFVTGGDAYGMNMNDNAGDANIEEELLMLDTEATFACCLEHPPPPHPEAFLYRLRTRVRLV